MIRRADVKDIDECIKLLEQVCSVHSKIRPDLFKDGATKYSSSDLEKLFMDDTKPVFVYEIDSMVVGYGFCQIIEVNSILNPKPLKTLYIDDICIDELYRGKHIGKAIFEYIESYAKSIGCYNVTLNVWEGNDSAKKFYQNMGMNIQKTTMEKIL